MEEEGGRFAHFELVSCKCVDTYVRVKKNQNQICWKWTKVRSSSFFLQTPVDAGPAVCRRASGWNGVLRAAGSNVLFCLCCSRSDGLPCPALLCRSRAYPATC